MMLVAMAGGVSAQTVITTEPVESRTIIAQRPLNLTPAQRTTIHRTIIPRSNGRAPIVRERVVTETVGRAPAVATESLVTEPRVRYVVGDRIPTTVEVAPLPEALTVSTPALTGYRYMVINNRVLLVDPTTSTVVAEVVE
jgi:hypothetical protein